MFRFEEGRLYKARDLLNVSVKEMEQSPEAANIKIEFDDGIVDSTSRECLISRFAWDLYSIFPYIKVSKKHHIGVAGGRAYNKSTLIEMLNTMQWDCTYCCQAQGIYPDLSEICKKIYDCCDNVANFYTRITEYSVFFQLNDFIEMNNHPEIVKARDHVVSLDTITNVDVSGLNGTIEKTLKESASDPMYRMNPIVKSYQAKGFRIGQYFKIAGIYGLITDVDNHLFRPCVRDNLLSGITDIRDLYMESRTAAMSLFFQKDAMRQSEYLTRMLQLIASSVMKVVTGNCGSTEYIEMVIKNRRELKQYEGIYWLNPETNEEEVITSDRTSTIHKLIRAHQDTGLTVQLRTVLTCKYPSRTAVCSHCYGKISESLFREDNIGMLAATSIQEIVTQSILSNKHLVVSSHGERNELTPRDLQYVAFRDPAWEQLWLSKRLEGKKVYITFTDREAKRIQDIMNVEDVRSLVPSRVTSFIRVGFEVGDGRTIEEYGDVAVGGKDREAYFTLEMLDYIKRTGWVISDTKTYSVDMSEWDWNDPFIGIPMVQYSMPAHMMAIKSMLTTTDNGVDDTRSISKYPNSRVATAALYELIQKRLEVHFTHVQTLVLSYLCEDPDNFDFRIPKDKSKGIMRPYNQVMISRDISLAMAYEKQFDTLKAPSTYVIGERQPHPHSNAMRG